MFLRSEVKSRLSKAEEALDKLQRNFRDLQMEWESAHDKLLRLVQRFTKRAEVVEAAEEESDSADEIPQEVAPGQVLHLNPHQMEQQRRILARRRNHGVLPG